jgi:hypothetical protein
MDESFIAFSGDGCRIQTRHPRDRYLRAASSRPRVAVIGSLALAGVHVAAAAQDRRDGRNQRQGAARIGWG